MGVSLESYSDYLLNTIAVRGVQRKVNLPDAPGAYAFNAAQFKYLEVYSNTLDEKKASEASGLTRASVDKNPYMGREIEHIQKAAIFKHRAKATEGNHHRLLDKAERLLDEAGDMRVKASLMGTVARMSDGAMKAAGLFKDTDDTSNVTAVQVVINIGGQQDNPVIIDG
jgi:hypothetical protein